MQRMENTQLMTQEPARHATAPIPLMAVQSTPPAFVHPPQLSMLDWVSTHSDEPSRPGMGHSVWLGFLQPTSRRTRRAPPEAATVFAVAATFRYVSWEGQDVYMSESRTAGPVTELIARRHAIGILRSTSTWCSRAWRRALTGWAGGARSGCFGVTIEA